MTPVYGSPQTERLLENILSCQNRTMMVKPLFDAFEYQFLATLAQIFLSRRLSSWETGQSQRLKNQLGPIRRNHQSLDSLVDTQKEKQRCSQITQSSNTFHSGSIHSATLGTRLHGQNDIERGLGYHPWASFGSNNGLHTRFFVETSPRSHR